MKNSFAVVCEWPNVNAAENETISRIKIASQKINKVALVIDKYGNILDDNLKKTVKKISNQDVDFVINLHFASPKCYDGFSYVALWNPIRFYHDWGYKKFSNNLLSHHDFISCLSKPADDHAIRISYIKKTKHLEPKVVLNHTNSGPYFETSENKNGIFYCGINWDKSSGKSRFSEIFENLDKENILKIYGPKKLGKMVPWKGFESYVGEISFDGISIFKEISKCLLGLALSHDAHIESEIASSRVFELIAGGALPICDENPFFKKYFGDKVLYVNGDSKNKIEQIKGHYKWASNNKDQVIKMVSNLQDFMKENFDLSKQLNDLYSIHEERRNLVEKQYCAQKNEFKVNIIYIHDCLNKQDDFHNLKTSIINQNYKNISLIIASNDKNLNKIKILDDENIKYEIHKYSSKKSSEVGLILDEIQSKLSFSENNLFLITNIYENLFYDHISSLVRCFEDNINSQIAISNAVLFEEESNYGIHCNDQDLDCTNDHNFCLGTLMFKNLPPSFILRYLDCRNYSLSIKNYFNKFLIESNIHSIKLKITKTENFFSNNYLYFALLNDYKITINKANFALSKDTAYKLISHIKFLIPFIRIRTFLKRIRINKKSN